LQVATGSIVRAVVLVAVMSAAVLVAELPAAGGVAARVPRRHHCTAGVSYSAVSSTMPRIVTVKVRRATVRRKPGADCPRLASLKRPTRLYTTGARAKAAGLIWFEVQGLFGRGWISAASLAA